VSRVWRISRSLYVKDHVKQASLLEVIVNCNIFQPYLLYPGFPVLISLHVKGHIQPASLF
jgi:hypothetical protein